MQDPSSHDLEALVRRLGPLIYRRCLKILGRAEEAADATQEVFLRITKHRHQLPPEAEQLPWAYTIATRICLNRIRDGRHELSHEDEGPLPGDALLSRSENGGAWVERRELISHLCRAHDEKTTTLAWLVHADGFSQEEAGKQVGLSRKSVGKKLAAFQEAARLELERLEGEGRA